MTAAPVLRMHLLAWAALACLLVAPSRGVAFDGPTGYEGSAHERGGGGGQFFTGGPDDRLTCEVCHRGAAASPSQLTGLPTGGFVPGDVYDIAFDWSSSEVRGATLEFLTPLGESAGDIEVPELAELAPEALCEGEFLAVSVVQAEGKAASRDVLVAEACESTSLRFRWHAPRDATPVRLYVASVGGDGDGGVEGDFVDAFVVSIPPKGAPLETAVVTQTCAAGGHAPPAGFFLLGFLFFAMRRRGAFCFLLLVTAFTPAGAQADEVTIGVHAMTDTDTTTVVAPRISGVIDLSDTTSINAALTADVWTSASVDIVASATPSITEVREELTLGATHVVDTVTIGGGYRLSHEPDYVSHAVFANVDWEVQNRSATLSLRLNGGEDVIGHSGDLHLSKSLAVLGGRVAYTQILDPETLIQLAYEANLLSGYQNSVYRYVPVGADNCTLAATCVPERHPNERVRHSLVIESTRSVGQSGSVGAALRGYTDSWGVMGMTASIRGSLWARETTLVQVNYRLHLQSSADFYQPTYAEMPADGIVTRDKELGGLSTHRFGLSWEEEIELSPEDPIMHVHVGLGVVRIDYDAFTPLDGVWGGDLDLAVGWEL